MYYVSFICIDISLMSSTIYNITRAPQRLECRFKICIICQRRLCGHNADSCIHTSRASSTLYSLCLVRFVLRLCNRVTIFLPALFIVIDIAVNKWLWYGIYDKGAWAPLKLKNAYRHQCSSICFVTETYPLMYVVSVLLSTVYLDWYFSEAVNHI
jgi:hypothetical protein